MPDQPDTPPALTGSAYPTTDTGLQPLFSGNQHLAGWVFICPHCGDSHAGPTKAGVQVEAADHLRRRHPDSLNGDDTR